MSKNQDIKFVQIRYTDVPGRFLAKYIANHKEEEIENLYKYGIGFDGSSVRGFAEINESDLMLVPDKSTSKIITSDVTIAPGYRVTRVIADVYRGFGQGRLSKDPRYISHTGREEPIKYLLNTIQQIHANRMQEQDNVRDILHQAFQALNNKVDRSHYFDLHDNSLVTHGLPENFSSDKEGMKKFYSEVFRAFPDANFILDHVIAEGNEAACMFSLTGTQKNEFMGVPGSDKQIKIDGMIFFRFRASKIVERWEIIDIVSAMKQLGARQQLSAVKNAILEYAEVRTNQGLKQKINGLFNKHQTTE